MPKMVRIMIVDDHPLIHQGIRATLSDHGSIKVVGGVYNTLGYLSGVDNLNPDVVLINAKLYGLDPGEYMNPLLSGRQMHLICLATSGDEDHLVAMVTAGARGAVMKTSEPSELISAIERVAAGETFYCRNSAGIVIGTLLQDQTAVESDLSMPKYSKRELDIIRLICLQYTSKEISEKVYLGAKTVEYYRQRIMDKMKVRNTVGVVIYAIKNRMVDIESI